MFDTLREYASRQRAKAGRRDEAEPEPTAEEAVRETERSGEVSTEVVGEPRPARFGEPGRPLNQRSAFYMGFVGAIGVVLALGLWHTIGRLSTTFTILLVSTFLTLALNPIVLWLRRRGLGRGASVAVVSLAFLGLLVLLALVVVPPVVAQAVGLLQAAPEYLDQLTTSPAVTKLNNDYGVVDKLSEEMKKQALNAEVVSNVFGGLLGVGRALVGAVFQVFTILVITLYLLASLPNVKVAAYGLVPKTRRPRFAALSEEILRRVGSYALGQAAVASVNGILSFVMMTVVGIPYAAILAVVVGTLGLIPMVGATLGAIIVCVVAAFSGIKLAIIAAIYYIVYQQFENYVVAPRVMQRTVSVPGIVTVIAAMIGGTLMGVIGALIAIPVAAGIILVYQEVVLPRQDEH